MTALGSISQGHDLGMGLPRRLGMALAQDQTPSGISQHAAHTRVGVAEANRLLGQRQGRAQVRGVHIRHVGLRQAKRSV